MRKHSFVIGFKLINGMRRIRYLFLLITICSLSAQGQTPNFQWVKGIRASAIAFDGAGNVYSTGAFVGTVDFDPGPGTLVLSSPANTNAAFLCKYTGAGLLVWAKSMSGTEHVRANALALDGSGNVYITGNIQGTADLDPGPGMVSLTSVGLTDIFVAKYSINGDHLWSNATGSVNQDDAKGIKVDIFANVYVTGIFSGPTDFDPGPGVISLTNIGNFDCFVFKLSAQGQFQWAKSFGGTNADLSAGLGLDASRNIYIGGTFRGTVDFDPGSGNFPVTTTGGTDPFVLKLDESGNFIWMAKFGNGPSDFGNAIAVSPNGDVLLTGVFDATGDFDPGPGIYSLTIPNINTWYAGFVVKLSSDRQFRWARQIGDSNRVNPVSLSVDLSGNVYTTGWFENSCTLPTGTGLSQLQSAGGMDGYFVALDSAGVQNWAFAAGTVGTDGGNCLASNNAGSIYGSGIVQNQFDFSAPAGIDTVSGPYLFKLGQSVGTTDLEFRRSAKLSVMPNPVTTKLTICRNYFPQTTALVTIYDPLGSIVRNISWQNGERFTVDISELPVGVYLLVVSCKEINRQVKLVKH